MNTTSILEVYCWYTTGTLLQCYRFVIWFLYNFFTQTIALKINYSRIYRFLNPNPILNYILENTDVCF